jgi:hypothetical protein
MTRKITPPEKAFTACVGAGSPNSVGAQARADFAGSSSQNYWEMSDNVAALVVLEITPSNHSHR